jgi:hypothetical protein
MIDPWQDDQYCWEASLGIDHEIEIDEAEGQARMDPTSYHEFIKTAQKLRAKSHAKSPREKPSKTDHSYWLYAEDTKRAHPEPTARSGKWLIFCKPEEIDEIWSKVKCAVAAGNLGKTAKGSTRKGFKGSDYVICVYTHDWKDEDSVLFIRQGLRDIGITKPIPYKTDTDTLAGRCAAIGAKGTAKFYE